MDKALSGELSCKGTGFALYLRDRVCSIFSGARKLCLAHGLRQLTQDTKSDVSCLQTLFMRL